ncbi:hypothetical protein F4802DRAFT_66908 [Xylaria palmicola]|nr:hypothetical protein F4802DRAFT_66908 [Xylaria palmicola]
MHNRSHSPLEEKRRGFWPMSGGGRAAILPWKSAATPKAGSRHLTEKSRPRLNQEISYPRQQELISSKPTPFASPVSPGPSNYQVFPVSPLSDQLPDDSGEDGPRILGLRSHDDRARLAFRPEAGDAPLTNPSIEEDSIQNRAQLIPATHDGNRRAIAHRLLSNVMGAKTFLSTSRSTHSTASSERYNMQGSTHIVEGGTATLVATPNASNFSPPLIPRRFSSLNAYSGPLTQNPVVGFHGDETFLLSTDEEKSDHTHDQSGLQSTSHSSIISQDLTQFDPGGPPPEVISRFSMSSAPPSSLEYSAPSISPGPSHHRQQRENPEIHPLRSPPPPLPGHSQLLSPVPRRPNLPADVRALEPFADGAS